MKLLSFLLGFVFYTLYSWIMGYENLFGWEFELLFHFVIGSVCFAIIVRGLLIPFCPRCKLLLSLLHRKGWYAFLRAATGFEETVER